MHGSECLEGGEFYFFRMVVRQENVGKWKSVLGEKIEFNYSCFTWHIVFQHKLEHSSDAAGDIFISFQRISELNFNRKLVVIATLGNECKACSGGMFN